MIECIGAITLATRDISRAVDFYRMHGECFFYLTDLDGHEMSFACPLEKRGGARTDPGKGACDAAE